MIIDLFINPTDELKEDLEKACKLESDSKILNLLYSIVSQSLVYSFYAGIFLINIVLFGLFFSCPFIIYKLFMFYMGI